MVSAVAALGKFQGGQQCDADKFISAIWSSTNEEDYKLSQSSCLKSCKENYPGDMAEGYFCCEYAEYKEGDISCTLANMTESLSLISQEYAQGNEKNDWFWAYMMGQGGDDWDWMGAGANSLAIAASSAILMANML